MSVLITPLVLELAEHFFARNFIRGETRRSSTYECALENDGRLDGNESCYLYKLADAQRHLVFVPFTIFRHFQTGVGNKEEKTKPMISRRSTK